jgi:hypothetical protein
VSELSGGQRQRVALARTIVIEPDVLLLDEPLAHLDFKVKQRLLGEVKRLQKELGITTIYVTHDQVEAMEVSDYIAIMRDGRIVQEGRPEEVYENPLDSFVASFFGDANIVELGEDLAPRLADPGAPLQARSGASLGEHGPHPWTGEGIHDGSPTLYLGTMIQPESGLPVFLDKRDLAGHVGVFGSTGTGKSTTLFTLACRASRDLGVSSLLLDWTGEHAGRLLGSLGGGRYGVSVFNPAAGDASINPLSLGGGDDAIDVVVEILSKALDLSEPQAFMLRRILEEASPSSLGELEAYIEAVQEESRWDREVKKALLRKVGVLTRGSARKAFSGREGDLLQVLEEGSLNVVKLDDIRNLAARRAYVLVLLASIFTRLQDSGDRREVLVALDEAHNVFTPEEPRMGLLELLVSESRKYGLYVALATQSPSLVPNTIILNTNTKIVHALRSYRDKAVISETMALPPGVQERIDKLPAGVALIQSVSLPEPVVIKVEKGRPVGDDVC